MTEYKLFESSLDFVYMWVFIIVLIILYSFINDSDDPLNSKDIENYIPFYDFKKYCGGCGYFNRRECSSCTNCGYCTTIDGNGECVPGDNFGPYFRKDCADWEYTDPYRRHPSTHKYPNIRNANVYPYYTWGNLRRGHWGFRRKRFPKYNRGRRGVRFNRRLKTKH